MNLRSRQAQRGKIRFLIETDPDPKTGIQRGLVVDLSTGSVQRVPSIPALLKAERWHLLEEGDPTLDDLVHQVPALRRFRGIEIRLPSGMTAWVLWRRWTSTDTALEARLSEITAALAVPAYEPDGDYFLALACAARLGGDVLDPPRSAPALGDEAY